MPQREQRPRPATAHVTVYKEDGTPVQYPKAQVARIEESTVLFLEDPTDVDPDEAPEPEPEPEPEPKPKAKPTAKTGSKK